MKKITNTATIQYRHNKKLKFCVASCSIMLLCKDNFLHGDVLCKPGVNLWQLALIQKCNGKTIFSLDGNSPKGFCFETDCRHRYILQFCSDKNCVLRLYNTPLCIEDVIHKEKKP